MHRTAYPLLLLTTLFWGGNAIAGKLAVGHVSPMLLTCGRWGLALLVLLAIGWRQIGRDWGVVRRNLPLLAALGCLGFSVFNVALYTALAHTTAINVSIEQAGMPMVILIVNFLLFRVRVTPAQIAGFLLSIAGVILTATHGVPSRLFDLELNFGDALMLIAILVYSLYTVALRFRPNLHWLSLMIALTGSAFVASVPFAAFELWSGAAILPDAGGWAIIAYTALFPSILSQLFYIRGVEMIGANRAGLFINLVPIFGTALSILLLGETFRTYHAVAMVLVALGIGLAEFSGRRLAARRLGE